MPNVFFFTDTHGRYELFEYIINWCHQQDPNGTIIFGGDAADRGNDGYKIIKYLLNHPDIIYLYGNHEEIFCHAARDLLVEYAREEDNIHGIKTDTTAKNMIDLSKSESVILHKANGGYNTLCDWLMDGADIEIINKISNLRRTFSYNNFDFCHAGGSYISFTKAAEAEKDFEPINEFDEQYLIWNRTCLPLGWETDRICVFGHTPVILLDTGIYGRDRSLAHTKPCAWQDKMGAKDKRGGWKIDMDTGMTWSGRAFVLNCNTLEVFGFENSYIRDIRQENKILELQPYKIINGVR